MPRGQERKKGVKGAVPQYMHRDHALKKLQISLRMFRKLCILKGVYPRQPPKQVSKNNQNRTWYSVKDISFLAHDPVIKQLRALRVYRRKLRRLRMRHEGSQAKLLRQHKPEYNFDHMVKERYPTLLDAVRDLDDPLSLVFLFSSLPQNKLVKSFVVAHCSRLALEFQNWVIKSRSLRRVFLSIKGIYYQASVMGTDVTWLQPYPFTQHVPRDIDMRIMLSFVEFAGRQLGYVMFHLYRELGLQYPPDPDRKLEYAGHSLTAFTFNKAEKRQTKKLGAVVQALEAQGFAEEEIEEELEEEDDEEDEQQDPEFRALGAPQATLFQGLCIFVQRETMMTALQFVITSCGGSVGWEGAGSPFDADSSMVTHVVVDRPTVRNPQVDREYVQPQWIFDSINEGRLLSPHEYAPGATLPPHLSPFVARDEGGYVPPRRLELDAQLRNEEEGEDEEVADDEMDLEDRARDVEERYTAELHRELGAAALTEEQLQERRLERKRERHERRAAKEQEDKDLAAGILSRRKRRLYNRIQYSRRAKAEQIERLKEKRRQFDEANK